MGTKRGKARFNINRYWILAIAITILFLAIYLLVEALRLPLLTDVSILADPTFMTGLISVGLLTIDAILPIPASLVMVANGALFGIVLGSIVSLAGSLLGFLVGYFLGSKGSPIIKKVVSEKDLEAGSRILHKWGMLAIILTRSLPILGETTAIMAGVSKLSFVKSFTAATIGLVPVSIIYALAGSQTRDFNLTATIFIALVILAAVVYGIDRYLSRLRMD